MKDEKRSHRRVKPKKIKASIFSAHKSSQEMALSGEIIDISRTGIRIKLSKPLKKSFNEKLKITMVLPDSGSPFTIHGLLKHQHSESEYGIHYTDHVDGSIDDLLFECVKLDESMLLIKSL